MSVSETAVPLGMTRLLRLPSDSDRDLDLEYPSRRLNLDARRGTADAACARAAEMELALSGEKREGAVSFPLGRKVVEDGADAA